MFLHNPKMMYTVRVDEPNPEFAKMLLEQFGGPNGELAAAMRYFTQGWNEPDGARRSMLLDIATEELSHLEMVAQTLALLLKGSVGAGRPGRRQLPRRAAGREDARLHGYGPEQRPERARKKLGHACVADSGNFGGSRADGSTDGFDLAQANSKWGFELDDKSVANASGQKVQ
jgi:Manganese containing catalase